MGFTQRMAALVVLLGLFMRAVAMPHLGRRAVSTDVYNKLKFYEQYAAAAYCPLNNNSTGTKVTCLAGNCPLVEAANTNTVLEFQNSLLTDVTGFVATDSTNNLIVVSFRGSTSVRNWIADFSFVVVPTDICTDCAADTGFWTSWDEAKSGVLAAVSTARVAFPTYQVVSTGHSLGGAIASLAAAELRKQGIDVQLYTYGSPAIGDAGIANYITNQSTSNFRVTHLNDPVPRLPPQALGYRHISPEYYISTGDYVPVTANDITRYDGIAETQGDSGDTGFDTMAHGWYFNNISSCSPDYFEFRKRGQAELEWPPAAETKNE